MNDTFKDILTDKRKLFVVFSLVVPFIVYCAYYYGTIISYAPYQGKQFEYIVLKKFQKGRLRESLNSKTGDYMYYNRKDSLVHRHVNLSKAEMHILHDKMMDMIFWSIRPVSGDSTFHYRPEIPVFFVDAVYQRKSKAVWWQNGYFEERKVDDRMIELVKTIEEVADQNVQEQDRIK